MTPSCPIIGTFYYFPGPTTFLNFILNTNCRDNGHNAARWQILADFHMEGTL